MSLKATATDIKDVEARSPATSALASADSLRVSMNLVEPFTSSSGAAAHSPEPAACSHGPADVSTALPTSQTLAERSTTPVPQAADVQEASNYAGQAQQTAVTEVLQVTGTFSLFWLGCLPLSMIYRMLGSTCSHCNEGQY